MSGVSFLSPHRGQHSLGGAAPGGAALVRRVIIQYEALQYVDRRNLENIVEWRK